MSFEVQVPGKWILAGEHAVLRGVPAIVFPLSSRFMTLKHLQNSEPLKLELDGSHGPELKLLFWSVLDKACEMKGLSRNELTGELKVSSTIPIGAGLGASAALCVTIARFFQHLGKVEENELYEFSRTLENMFHGESSGVDIAVALSQKGLKFVRNGERSRVKVSWQPKWYVSYSGKRGVTLECVNKVKHLIAEKPELGQNIDNDMKKAVALCEQGLQASEETGFPLLKEGIDLAAKCFEQWHLTPKEHVDFLKKQGAVAVKPTGSGDGGYVLSLWKTPPPETLKEVLISC